MIDKMTEKDLRSVKEFLEFWMKFHSFYSTVIAKDLITKDDEDKFLGTKEMMRAKYGALRNDMDYKYAAHGRLTDPVKDILEVNTIRFMSEKNLKKMGEDWKDSYVFLNNILERLKMRKRRLEQFNPIGVFLKRVVERG
ncbi:MAG: hypothetical protein A2987_06470 [Omnitrophica bacterium RIFCSPLOWO2_01_FULL_45_10]|nr:MAG: hypothetical protein A2987_06470 [Omnitrophica bacterium RIFCSPLOWO2_01_FULL_45_10]